MRYAKQKKDELMEDYYNWFLWLCVVIPQQPNDIYLRETFRDGLWTRVKIVIISMPWKTLAKVTKSEIIVEEKLLVRWKNIARYHQANFDNEESNEKDEENHCKTKKKDTKVQFDTTKKGVYCQNCYNEGQFTKECKLLNKLCQICKSNEHNTNHCPNKVVSGRCPLREIVPIHEVQTKILVIQEQQ